jgi:hypothetical protein
MVTRTGADEKRHSTGSTLCDEYLGKLDKIKHVLGRMEEKLDMVFGAVPRIPTVEKAKPCIDGTPVTLVSCGLDSILSRIVELADRLGRDL